MTAAQVRKAERKRAPFFAEIAEALGVETSDVLAAWANGDGEMTAMFSRETDASSPVLSVRFKRDHYGILRAGLDVDTGLTVAEMFTKRKP